MDNLFTQVSNHKRFLLFDPQQTSSLYPFPATSKIPHMSQINIEKPDLDKFPNFQKAKYFECIVKPGEILFIPAFWWHQVYSLVNSNQELNISVIFWSKPPISQFLTPPGRTIGSTDTHSFKVSFSSMILY